MNSFKLYIVLHWVLLLLLSMSLQGQEGLSWTSDGKGYYILENGNLIRVTLPSQTKTVLVKASELIPPGNSKALDIRQFTFTQDEQQVLLLTNTRKVWRLETRGDYWVLDRRTATLQQLGKQRPASSLMFTKFSPDGQSVAYVSDYNIYVEELTSGISRALTKDGNRKFINGTFDWVYEEEFFCRDGFRWSPDSKQIAFWQIDARNTKDYLMINNTDSIYPFVTPVEYPIAGEPPSPFRIGAITVATGDIQWMSIPTDPVLQSYVPRMEWAANSKELIVQHLNRHQNFSELLICNSQTGASRSIYQEKDSAWIDILPLWDEDYAYGGWDWLNGGNEFLWTSEKDGWRHVYRVSRDGQTERLLTPGSYDVMDIAAIDEPNGYLYFHASPDNATQKYLYRTRLDGKGKLERITPLDQSGTHDYDVSPGALFAQHHFSSHQVRPVTELIALKDHQFISGDPVKAAVQASRNVRSPVEFFTVLTEEGVSMDAWRVLPDHFDPQKKYPLLFYVYTEPWGQNVKDVYGVGKNFLYQGDLGKDGYIYVSIDNRGTPVPKGRAWRKSIYRKIGQVNIRDQALAARQILQWPYVDSSRIAVWGWSGGGSATLNLLFQYPEIYKTGIAIAAVANQQTYDNIYQERYMGLPQENKDDFRKGSPLTYAKNLTGNLLYIHGSGDDNVHYNNSEMLVNALIRHNKLFQLMVYPNRTHSITEGQGTSLHLANLYTQYLRTHCLPGGR